MKISHTPLRVSTLLWIIKDVDTPISTCKYTYTSYFKKINVII